MQNSTLQKYVKALTRVKRGSTKYGMAPHKPILLITLIELVQNKIVLNNRFEVNADLVGIFHENWRLLVQTPHQSDFTQPFYYLQSDKVDGQFLWTLYAKPGCQINALIKSVNTLAEVLDYGALSDDLFILLTDPISSQVILNTLLETYFPTHMAIYGQIKQEGKGYYNDLESYVLNEPEIRIKKIKVETEEEVFVRNELFKRYIPQLYQSTCAFTGMRLTSTFGHSFIDACHIIPFSVGQDDKVTNGIALCPNMHRAFDRGLLSISTDYTLLVSPHIYEDEEHYYSLNRMKDKAITLPQVKQYWPSRKSMEWHRTYVFKI